MTKTVYVLGAGINREVKDWDGLRPPLAGDFFQQALKHGRIGSAHYRSRIQCVLDYIQKYWKLSAEQLELVAFDLEECFTMLQLQISECHRRGDTDKHRSLLEVEYRLTIMFAEYLDELAIFARSSHAFQTFGQIIHAAQATIITFNYDCLLESVLESASHVRGDAPRSYRDKSPEGGEIPDELLQYSHFVWNRPLAYGVQFDEIQLQQAGIPVLVPGERFYAHPENKLYTAPLLKLHGSLNWFQYSGIKRFPNGQEQGVTRQGRTLLYGGHWWFNEAAEVNGEIITPILITPVLHKNLVGNSIIRQVWDRARQELAQCKCLVVGGYSFPPTDFHTKRLFLEAFAESPPDEVIVINPDKSVIGLVKKLCHFTKPVVSCQDLEEFITLYDSPGR